MNETEQNDLLAEAKLGEVAEWSGEKKFGYGQYHMRTIADTIYLESKLRRRKGDAFTGDTAQAFRDAIALLRVAEVYARRIDWFLSGDDTEEGFHARLREELERVYRYTQTINGIKFPEPEKDDA